MFLLLKELYEAAATSEIFEMLFVGTWKPGGKPRALQIDADFEIH